MNEFLKKLNNQQRIIIAILLPILCFIVFIPILDFFDGHNGKWEKTSSFSSMQRPDIFEPFFFQKTWLIWLLYICLLLTFEYKLFEKTDKKK